MQKKDKVIAGDKIKPGDVIIGVASTGVHSNGLSLARVLWRSMPADDKKFKGKKTFGEELLTPTRIYNREPEGHGVLHGAWHVPRHRWRPAELQPADEYGFRFDTPITPPEIFAWIQKSRRHLIGRDVPHLQHGHGLCICRAEGQR